MSPVKIETKVKVANPEAVEDQALHIAERLKFHTLSHDQKYQFEVVSFAWNDLNLAYLLPQANIIFFKPLFHARYLIEYFLVG